MGEEFFRRLRSPSLLQGEHFRRRTYHLTLHQWWRALLVKKPYLTPWTSFLMFEGTHTEATVAAWALGRVWCDGERGRKRAQIESPIWRANDVVDISAAAPPATNADACEQYEDWEKREEEADEDKRRNVSAAAKRQTRHRTNEAHLPYPQPSPPLSHAPHPTYDPKKGKKKEEKEKRRERRGSTCSSSSSSAAAMAKLRREPVLPSADSNDESDPRPGAGGYGSARAFSPM
ncbi:hypothetical protein MUK42_35364 [Musa troglodytarum]|uniref:Uncharacterized protein n=1 Tax=Musa troglodytarum TaxID=320322 RepID=A0A9E7GLE8_9LILI|nr:hypothetical protein MUK42_35364 [Musa troglodytarum]